MTRFETTVQREDAGFVLRAKHCAESCYDLERKEAVLGVVVLADAWEQGEGIRWPAPDRME